MVKDYYDILGVEKGVDDKTLKKTYRKLSKKYHPDVNKDNPEAEEKFKEVAEAYDVLSDPEKRQNYDTYGTPNGRQSNPFGGGFDMNDIFEQFFGNNSRSNRVKRGGDIRVNIKLTLEDIFSGVQKKIKYKRNASCDTCSGTGGDNEVCTTCRGMGQINRVQNTLFGKMQSTVQCGICNGNGKITTNECNKCGGEGLQRVEELLDFEIPPGIMEGEQLVIKDKGSAVKDGISGQLIINIIELPHEIFKRKNIDLHQRLTLTYKELVLGVSKEIRTIDGKIRLNIKEGTEVGHILRVPQKGLKRMDNRGDLMLEIWVDIPSNLTEEEKNKIKSL